MLMWLRGSVRQQAATAWCEVQMWGRPVASREAQRSGRGRLQFGDGHNHILVQSDKLGSLIAVDDDVGQVDKEV